jgi:non-ribosomal peptide synthase protein (TIGR01720 family)
LPTDVPGPNLVETAETLHAWIDSKLTRRLLLDVPRTFGVPVHACLVGALGRALSAWSRSPTSLIDVESHGRDDSVDDVDLSRTVGWLTVFLPVLLRSAPDDPPSSWLKEADLALRDLPQRGLDDFVNRYLRNRSDGRTRPPLPRAVRFNYLGRQDLLAPRSAWFGIATGNVGPLCAATGRRTHLLELDAEVSDERLALTWTYSRELHTRQSIAALSQLMIAALTELANSARGWAYPRWESATSGFDLLPGELQQALAELKEKSQRDDHH